MRSYGNIVSQKKSGIKLPKQDELLTFNIGFIECSIMLMLSCRTNRALKMMQNTINSREWTYSCSVQPAGAQDQD